MGLRAEPRDATEMDEPMNFDLPRHTLLLTIGGSRAYGIHTAASDVDVKGVAVPPASYLHGFLHRFDQADKPEQLGPFAPVLSDEERAAVATSKLEGVVYDLRKFMGLAAEANPNILDVLFCRDAEVRVATPLGERLRAARGAFLSQKCRYTFAGYAHAQLKRIRTHREWLLHPPKEEPTRTAHGLPEGGGVLPRDQLGALDTLMERGMTAEELGLSTGALELLQREKHFRASRNHWEQYQHWKLTRNPARAALEERHGYDTKHGAHLVRLLRMGKEILTTGDVRVWRGDIDAAELLEIRSGAWEYDRLIAYADGVEEDLEKLYRAGASPLPREPDRAALDELCVELVEAALGEDSG
ncbi:MAG: nucleotidyltransferase domain-containing protein [Pseudomonadota bacterium]|nr:nucleotidyltransferase domain-containing protein [Pseudomonadota bacterium]